MIEAKPEGTPLVEVERQSCKYVEGLPAWMQPPVYPLPFIYESTGAETRLHVDLLAAAVLRLSRAGTAASQEVASPTALLVANGQAQRWVGVLPRVVPWPAV